MPGLLKLYWGCVMLSLGLTASLLAQSDSVNTAQNSLPPERLAILGFSETSLLRKPSQNLAQALAKVCGRDPRFIVTAENTLTVYLKKRRRFSIFIPDSAQALCKNLALQSLLAVSVEPKVEAAAPNLWVITLRWLEGSTGQITKIHVGEYQGDPNTAESFPLNEMLNALLDAPDIIVPAEHALAEMPLVVPIPEITASFSDSTSLNTPPATLKRRRNWFWYFTGAALVSGGSAAILLKNPAKAGPAGKALLPEPPDPPK